MSRIAAYLKTAFTTKWNLLLLGGGVAAAFISGFPGVILPLVIAGWSDRVVQMLRRRPTPTTVTVVSPGRYRFLVSWT